MFLLRALNIVPPGMDETPYPPAKDLDKIKNELVDAAEASMRAGVILTSDDWLAMGAHEKAAMIYAGNAIRDEQAIKIARCTFDPDYRAALESEYDGGKALKEHEYDQALGDLLGQMKRVAVPIPMMRLRTPTKGMACLNAASCNWRQTISNAPCNSMF